MIPILKEVFITLQTSEPADFGVSLLRLFAGFKLLSPLLFEKNYVNVARRGGHFSGAEH